MIKLYAEKLLECVKFEKALYRDGSLAPELVNVILQNQGDGKVLFGASMSKDTLNETLETGFAVLYSRSRKCRWLKGETSGNKLKVVSIYLNCDNDQLLIMVVPQGEGVCHETDEKGKYKPTCFSKLLLEAK